jgi:hypothetical protein
LIEIRKSIRRKIFQRTPVGLATSLAATAEIVLLIVLSNYRLIEV